MDNATPPPPHRFSDRFQSTVDTLFCDGSLDVLEDMERNGVPEDYWFTDELEAELRAHTLTPETWGELTDSSYGYFDVDLDWSQFELDMRSIWHVMAPGRTFPWDPPGSPPAALADHTNQDGLSMRLASTLRLLIDRGSPHQVGVAVRDGVAPHVPHLLEGAVRAGQFTPEAWARIAYQPFVGKTEPATVPADTVAHDLHALWTQVYPDRPYPASAEES